MDGRSVGDGGDFRNGSAPELQSRSTGLGESVKPGKSLTYICEDERDRLLQISCEMGPWGPEIPEVVSARDRGNRGIAAASEPCGPDLTEGIDHQRQGHVRHVGVFADVGPERLDALEGSEASDHEG